MIKKFISFKGEKFEGRVAVLLIDECKILLIKHAVFYSSIIKDNIF